MTRSIQRITAALTTPAVSNNLTTLANAKLELGITPDDTSNDAWLALAIGQVSGAIAAYCNRNFANQPYFDLFRDRRPTGSVRVQGGADPLVLGRVPVAAVADVFDLTGAYAVPPPAVNQFGPQTTLAASMTSGQTTLPLASALGSAYPFDVLVDTGLNQEVMTITALPGGNNYTVTRAAAGTTARAHNSGVPVTQALDPTLFEFEAGTGFLTRLNTDGNGNFWPTRWGTGEIAVAYIAGFMLAGATNPNNYPVLPAEIEEAALRMITMRFKGKGRDPMLRIQGQPGIGQQTYWIGTPPGQVGSLPPEIAGLVDPYRILPI